jgi:hypothetical protein
MRNRPEIERSGDADNSDLDQSRRSIKQLCGLWPKVLWQIDEDHWRLEFSDGLFVNLRTGQLFAYEKFGAVVFERLHRVLPHVADDAWRAARQHFVRLIRPTAQFQAMREIQRMQDRTNGEYSL